ncbi:hypothetical protein SELMODRAFT_441289 [Selaginella moellendorffii]|uniref:Uncharacterized protein n=1 Tax=Selaginella moellendorffii TaxID=88036 RepID=D8RIA2_SELML|nr:uncharacterized protein LOC9633005 [Selaginella moellendorffii]EFJ28210.1 hypothetical protein SELMODRAFT_441289 [Selaginella moellendorffii]|eukprot:XP_002970884.1 uncharacterized protein LOC9633005 [Selaginella moellendorffii]
MALPMVSGEYSLEEILQRWSNHQWLFKWQSFFYGLGYWPLVFQSLLSILAILNLEGNPDKQGLDLQFFLTLVPLIFCEMLAVIWGINFNTIYTLIMLASGLTGILSMAWTNPTIELSKASLCFVGVLNMAWQLMLEFNDPWIFSYAWSIVLPTFAGTTALSSLAIFLLRSNWSIQLDVFSGTLAVAYALLLSPNLLESPWHLVANSKMARAIQRLREVAFITGNDLPKDLASLTISNPLIWIQDMVHTL